MRKSEHYYNTGKFVIKKKAIIIQLISNFFEYLGNVSIARQSINSELPNFLCDSYGDIIDIGGYTKELEELVNNGKYRILDILNNDTVDIVANAERLPFINNSINSFVCISVIEHTSNPYLVVSEIYRCLAPAGRAFISIPFLFETHMEPNDYVRFTIYQLDRWFKNKEIELLPVVNNYYGLIAHFLQKKKILKYSIGTVFYLLGSLSSKRNYRFSTQINFILYKKEVSCIDFSNIPFHQKLCCPRCSNKDVSNLLPQNNKIICSICKEEYIFQDSKLIFE